MKEHDTTLMRLSRSTHIRLGSVEDYLQEIHRLSTLKRLSHCTALQVFEVVIRAECGKAIVAKSNLPSGGDASTTTPPKIARNDGIESSYSAHLPRPIGVSIHLAVVMLSTPEATMVLYHFGSRTHHEKPAQPHPPTLRRALRRALKPRTTGHHPNRTSPATTPTAPHRPHLEPHLTGHTAAAPPAATPDAPMQSPPRPDLI